MIPPPGPFAVWITGLPAAGKSTLAAELRSRLSGRGVEAVVLESDGLRRALRLLEPVPRYDEEGRDAFYEAMLRLGLRLLRHGSSVLFDATANRRAYRDRARERIPRFLEVYVDTPLAVCESRDPKGIYRLGRCGRASAIPGLSAPYEPPSSPEIVVRGASERAGRGAQRILALLERKGWIPPE